MNRLQIEPLQGLHLLEHLRWIKLKRRQRLQIEPVQRIKLSHLHHLHFNHHLNCLHIDQLNLLTVLKHKIHTTQKKKKKTKNFFSDVDAPLEPNLSQDQMEALNSLLLAPRPNKITILDPDLQESDSTWFGYDKSKLTRHITKCFTNKFDGPYYSWSCVPRLKQERYFVEFAKKHRWDPTLTGLVQKHFESIIQLRLKDMVSTVRSKDEQPKWIHDKLCEQMKTHWSTEEQIAKSATTSATRLSERNGLGVHKHASGQKSYQKIEQEMVVELGRPVSFGEVFIRANTKKDGTFVDKKAEKVVEAYMKKKGDKLANLSSETIEILDGRHPLLSIEEDNELFIHVK